MGAEPEFVVEADAAALASAVAARTLATLVTAQAERELAHLVVTGGSILEAIFDAINASPDRDAVDWSRVAVWEADERFVPAKDPDRNDIAGFAKLFGNVALLPENVHMMSPSGADFGDDANAAAEAYAIDLAIAADPDEDVPRFDVVLLGMGPDGHCASLFPLHLGTFETDASVIAVHDSPKPPPTRL